MKERISVTLDKEIIDVLDSLSRKRKFRNRSHIVEYAVERLAEQELASGMTGKGAAGSIGAGRTEEDKMEVEDKKAKGESKYAQKD